MTPPKIPYKNPSFLEWAPGSDASAGQGSDCSSCHTTTKPPQDFSFQNSNPFFLDQLKADKKVDPEAAAALQAWMVDGKFPPATKPQLKTTPSAATPKPGAPQDAAALNDQAKELERQARLSLDPAKKLGFYHSALSFRLLAGDDVASAAVLKELDGIYAKAKNETGRKFVAATQLWVEGKADESLQALADLNTEAQGQSWNFHQTYASQRSLLLQSAAGEKLKNADYAGAKPLLLEALTLTPTDGLTAKVLKLLAQNGEADLLGQKRNIVALESQREKLATPPDRCNTSCHSSNSGPLVADFDYAPLMAQIPGAPVSTRPDLSKYRRLTHLSYQEKLQLHDLDQEIQEASARYQSSQETVRNLLFVKSLDDPKQDIGALEEKMLKGAVAFSGPDRSLPWHLASASYLAKKDYVKAEATLQSALREDSSHVDALFALGQARFATGDFQGSREAYGKILKHQPQDVVALRYRIDASSHYHASLDPKLHADEIKTVERETASDRALLLARHSQGEKDKIAELGKQLERLREGGEASLEVRQETLAMMANLATQYLAFADTPQSSVMAAELVRKEMSGLAAETFELLAKFAKADSDPCIQKKAGLYSGYASLAQGKIDEAVKAFGPYRKEVPEVEKILGTLEKNKLRMVNLAALDAWEVYNKEGERIQTGAQNGILGSVIGNAEGLFRDDGKDFRDDTKARWKGDVAFVAELKKRVESGKADTILQAMEQIEKDGPAEMKGRARSYINYEDIMTTGYPLGALVHFVDKLPPDEAEGKTLLRKTWDLERQNPAVETPYAFYTLVDALTPNVAFNGTPRQHMDALEGHGSFSRSAFKFVTSLSPETLAVDVLLMAGSAGLGNLAKLAALSKLEKAGVTGYKALFLAGAVGVGVEGSALWAANLGKEAMTQDPSKVFTQEHMLKSYGATLIMIGGLKGFGAVGESLAPRAAKSLGLVAEGGTKLTAGGKVLTWSIGHGSGLSGMIATSHLNQAAGLTPKPLGGWKEGLVHDVFGYVQFAVAHKIADRALSGKLSAVSKQQHSQIAVKEAVVLAKSHADALGFPASRNAKGEIVDSPDRKALIGILAEAALSKPGFSGGKLAKLATSRQFEKANSYFAEFGLPLEYNRAGQLVAVTRGELSPHAAAGIPAGKAKPPRTQAEAEAYFKELGERAAHWMDKAAEWLFGPPGGGGFGGMQPALAGAYGMAAPKAEPKGPPTVFMAGKTRGTNKPKDGKKGAAPIEPVNLPAEKAAKENPRFEVVPHTFKEGDNFESTLGTLREHMADPAKIVVISATRPIEKPETIAERIQYFDPAARVEVHLPDGSVKVVEGKTRIEQVREEALFDGREMYWEAGERSVRDLFRIEGKKGEIMLGKPEGLKKVEIESAKPLSPEDVVFLLNRARDLGVEITVTGDRGLSFRAGDKGLEVISKGKVGVEELGALASYAAKAGENLVLTTEAGKIEIQIQSGGKDPVITTKDAKAALLAPETITLSLDGAPTGAEIAAFKAQGVRKLRFQDDPSAPGWALKALEAMKQSQGLDVRANDAEGKLLWENMSKPEGDVLKTQGEKFREALLIHAEVSGWKNRLEEMKKLLGPEGSRFDFASDTLRGCAARDLSAASVPAGRKEPAVSVEQFESWLKRGAELAAFKHKKAEEKGKTSLARELAPFAEGFRTDPAAADAWTQTVSKVREFLKGHRDNPALLAKAFENLQRDPIGSEAFENNAYDLAKFFTESSSPHLGLKRLNEFYDKASQGIVFEGNFFGTFLSANLGARPEQNTAWTMIGHAEALTAMGHRVVIEAIPTSKTLEGTTPDFRATVLQGTAKSSYFVEVKKVASMTVAGGNKESFAADLAATFLNPGKKDDASLGTQVGKGLAQLNRYSGKRAEDNLLLSLHLDGPPPPYFVEVLKEFLAKNCPNIAVRFQFKETQSYSPSGSGKIEVRTVETADVVRADVASRYANYDGNPNYFAPSLPDRVAAE